MRNALGGIANILLLEDVPYDLRLPLSAAQVTTNAGYQLGAVAGTAFPKTVGFDVLVQQFIGVGLRAVSRQADQAQACSIGADKLFGSDRGMHRVAINSQRLLARSLLEQTLHEANAQLTIELAVEHHEGKMAAVRDGRNHVAAEPLPGCANDRCLPQWRIARAGVPRASIYRARRRRRSVVVHAATAQPRPPLALNDAERERVLAVLNSERFADMAPPAIYATLLDRGQYLASVRTMYRLLAAEGQSLERRCQRAHPVYAKPELLAVRSNEVWSWDISKLKGPVLWSVYHLYVILDIFSRYVVGWMVALRESAEFAEQLIAETIAKQHIAPGTLTLHADRARSMRSKTVAQLLIDLDVARTHSRPHVSDDNPYSESQFKTLKYRPDFPERFGSLEDARAHCQRFFHWYNNVHRHSGIGLMTPHAVHYGTAEALQVSSAPKSCSTPTRPIHCASRAACRCPRPRAAYRSVDQSAKGNRIIQKH